jgi:hypothetical protein
MQCDRKMEDCANLARCYMDRVNQLQARLRMLEAQNEATFNKMIQLVSQESEKPPGQRNYHKATYEETVALKGELETLRKICAYLDTAAQSKLNAWLTGELEKEEE